MILSINTAFSCSDVALKFEDVKDYVTTPSSAKQAENILGCVDSLLKKYNKKPTDINYVGVVVGPGSFTGIRIGIGLVKGFTVAKPNLKLVSVCSLDLMAHIAKDNLKSDFWCVLNALSGNIFACKYNFKGERLTQPEMLFGEALNMLKGDVVGLSSEKMELCNTFIDFSPKSLLDYTNLKVQNGEFVEENELLPIYLRKSQAEISLENKNGN